MVSKSKDGLKALLTHFDTKRLSSVNILPLRPQRSLRFKNQIVRNAEAEGTMQRIADGAIRFGRETCPLRWTVRSTFIVGLLVFRTATFYWLREAF